MQGQSRAGSPARTGFERQTGSPGAGPPAKRKILVVDDEQRIVQLLRRELGRVYRVYTATGGVEALEILEREPIVLVIVDQRMPGMSGTELLSKVVDRHPDTVRILLTGYTDLNALVGAINEGHVYRYIAKPWEPEELKIVVRQCVEKYELEERNRTLVQDLRQMNAELCVALQSLERAQQDLLRAERLSTIGKLANMIVHDFKNPLTSVIGLSQMLTRSPGTEEEKLQRYARMIQSESQRMYVMVQEILSYVRGENMELEPQPLDVGTILEEVRQELEMFLEGSGVRLRLESACPQEMLLLDREKIKRVLHNLTSNAREAMEAGGEILLSAVQDDGHVCLRIADQGKGIPEECREKIFEPFFTRGKSSGSGMGLAIVKGIVEAHEGRIELESTGTAGTTFRILLPRREIDRADVFQEAGGRLLGTPDP